MKTVLAVILPLALLVGSAGGETQQQAVAFYDIALTCPSAPKLGCGSRAKRVLATLTADKRVAAAWVNEAGTRLAVGWTQTAAAPAPDQLNEILGPHGLAVNAIDEKTRAELLASFRTNHGWFDSGSIDELSRKESAIIAERLVRRLAKRVPVTDTQNAALVKAIMSSCWDRGGCQVEQDATSIAEHAKLDRSGLDALREVIDLGYRPLDNEQ
ncbi:MAG TPA: hypothetical protein VGQ36_28195 [Thermoanaerobaculia bacterium]|jgi:hypothetical protein|nr:hypothetical protein [Thermoanaerobaculia bacterium]